MAAPRSPEGNKGHSQPFKAEVQLCCHRYLSQCLLSSRHQHRPLRVATKLISTGHYSSSLCISLAWGRSWIFISSGRLQREMRGREEGAIGKPDTNYTSSDESHLDCSEAKTLPRWLPVKHVLSKYLSFLPARPPVELPSPTIYWIESTKTDKITFLTAAKKSETVDNSREKDF